MLTGPALHWAYNLWNAPLKIWPFPHVSLANSIPAELYAQILQNLPEKSSFKLLHETGRVKPGKYPQRSMVPQENLTEFWWDLFGQMIHPEFGLALCGPFFPAIYKNYPDIANFALWNQEGKYGVDVMICEDVPPYHIGPHTDNPQRICSALFYLGQRLQWVCGSQICFPSGEPAQSWGTSFYLPKNRGERNIGDGHFQSKDFDIVYTEPWQPNGGLLFLKTQTSWHGVEPIPPIEGERRIILLADVRRINVKKQELNERA